jgi:NAD(P)-dependent dehydrogenase (short-subunit alcohol dehydrogenase family)
VSERTDLTARPEARENDRLAGKVAIVTGAGSGLGASIAQVLAESSVKVVALDVRREHAERTLAGLDGHGADSLALGVDVADAGEVEDGVRRVLERFGRLDIVVNNAATDLTVSVEEFTVEQWRRVIDVNLVGPFLCAKAAFPHMREQGGGSIVNIVSTAAKRAWANASAYHASKWGLLGFSHALHVEGRPLGIKVTALISGGMRTPFLLDRFPDIDTGLLQDPRNVAETVRFVLTQPAESVIPEMMVMPMTETSWP